MPTYLPTSMFFYMYLVAKYMRLPDFWNTPEKCITVWAY